MVSQWHVFSFHQSLYTNNSLDSSDTGGRRLLLYDFKRDKFAGIFCMWAAANFFRVSGDCVHFDYFTILPRKNTDRPSS